jgi:hypothetical protein
MWKVSVEAEPKPQLLYPDASQGQISPDGKWVAYTNFLPGGRPEVHVRPFPSGSGVWKVSANAGFNPRWRHDGKELFYMGPTPARELMAVPIQAGGAGFQYGDARKLFDSELAVFPHRSGNPAGLPYAVSRDGKRFLIPRAVDSQPESAATPITVILNWQALLNR